MQKKVFFIPTTASQEQLLYNFNLNVGDTLPTSFNNGSNSNKILGIDSVLVGTVYHKRYYLTPTYFNASPNPNFALIEGVGSTLGLLQPIMYDCVEACSVLNCFEHNGQSYPPNYSCAAGITETNKQKFVIEIYPNPFSSQTTLQADNIFNDATLTAYNIMVGSLRPCILRTLCYDLCL